MFSMYLQLTRDQVNDAKLAKLETHLLQIINMDVKCYNFLLKNSSVT